MISSEFKEANILIVDDLRLNVYFLTNVLKHLGYTNIESTTDPRQVLDLYHSFQPDLILLDLMMPYMTGYEVMDQLRSVIPDNTYLPVLVITADLSVEAKQRALTFGARDFLTKPIDSTEVGLRMDNLLFARYLYLQLSSQNQDLEDIVRKRTLELENTNAALKIAKEKAESSDRLKTAFLNNISHEIRTPLNGILGMYQVINDPDLSQDEKEQYFSHLQRNSDRLIQTVTNYVDIAMLDSGNVSLNVSLVDIDQLMHEIFERFNEMCLKKNLLLILQKENHGRGIQLYTDHEMVSKAISQLIDNAIKFTAEGSITFGVKKVDHTLEFFIRDTGTGISENMHDAVFEYFSQEDISNTRGYDGTGLGLAIAKQIVMLLGGNITLKSAKGEGSEFKLMIPWQQVDQQN